VSLRIQSHFRDACGRCFQLQGYRDPYNPLTVLNMPSIVVKVTDCCPVQGNVYHYLKTAIVNARPYAINLPQILSTRMERSRTLIYVQTAAQRRPSSLEGSGCVFAHGKKFPVRSGRAHRTICNGGTVVWLNHRAFGRVQ